MNPRRVAEAVSVCLLLLVATPPCLRGDDAPPTEKEKIEAPIKHVEGLKDTTFIRNDQEYDARVAARFLRGKWQAREKEIKTAMDFIEKTASVSSTTNKPYLIRMPFS